LKDVPHGDVLIKDYFAKTSNTWRHIFIYLPPGYYANASARYPVLYLQHGGGEDATAWLDDGHVNWILDNMLAERRTKPIIAVMETSDMPDAASGRGAGPGSGPGASPLPTGGSSGAGRGFGMARGGGAYGQLVIRDLIPWIDSHFRTVADKDHRGIAGLYAGAMQTAAISMVNLDKFSYVGLLSGGAASGFGPNHSGPVPTTPPPPLDLKTMYSGAMANPADFNKKVKVLFLSSGTELPLENPEGLKTHYQQLVDAGVTNTYLYLSPGTAHEWQNWRRSFYVFASLLF
jgi:hypothetical protein